ncbi:MAG: hypothetical protein ACXWC4_03370 [Telluria sp.]
MLRSLSKEDRRIFRESLVKTILNCPGLSLSSDAERTQFIDQLSQSWIIIPDAPDSDRIRSLKKVASDCRRLKQALRRLSSTDAALLDDRFQHTASMSSRVATLDDTAANAESAAAALRGRQRAIQQLQQGYAGARLIKLLEINGVPCSTRNDHEKRPVETEQAGPSKRTRNYDYLPSLDCGATLAMRCAMLAMFDAGVVELDWSATVAAIKAGARFQKALAACDRNIKETSFEILREFAQQRRLIQDGIGVSVAGSSDVSVSELKRPH